MSDLKESRFQKKVIGELRMLPRCWHLKSQEVAKRGIPDILMCLNGHFVALELKANEKSPVAELQTYTLNRIADARGLSYLTYPANWDLTFKDIVQKCLKDVPLDELESFIN